MNKSRQSYMCHLPYWISVTCHPTQVNAPRHRLELPTSEGWKTELT